MLMNYNCYYVYAYHNDDNEIYYIGKGKNDRAYEKHSGVNVPDTIEKITIISDNLTEVWAFALERRLIRWYGRKDKKEGILENKTNGGNGASGTVHQSKIPKERPWCPECNIRHCAPNYYRDGIRHWRKMCAHCIEKSKSPDFVRKEPRWKTNGYVKKMVCDICRFKAKYPTQMTVHHIDGNLNNSALTNLRTVCLNCVEVIKRTQTIWKPGDLEADH